MHPTAQLQSLGQRGMVQAHGCGQTRCQEILQSLPLTMAMGEFVHSLGNGVHRLHCFPLKS